MTSADGKLLIGGEWVDASDKRTIAIINPATEEVVGTTPRATEGDIDCALNEVERGWQAWRHHYPDDRSRVMEDAAHALRTRVDELARLLTIEQGKPLAEARSEVGAAIDQLSWYAGEARRIYGRIVSKSAAGRRMVFREPIGPVAAFTPWNFPVLLAMRKMAPALAAGCSVLLKPAEEAPSAVGAMVRALVEHGLPDGVVNVLTGDPGFISSRVLRSPVIRKMSFTGSVPVGQLLARQAADRVLDSSLELGGHAPVIIFDDVDPDKAARLCVAGKFRNAGQICISPTRFYVHERIANAFIAAFHEYSSVLRVGSGLDPMTQIGPLASEKRRAQVNHLVDDALNRGARALGHPALEPRLLERGYFYPPVVLVDLPEEAELLWTEPFGPVAPIMIFNDVDDVVDRANGTPFGLAGYILTNTTSVAFDMIDRLEVGIVGVNQFGVSAAAIPFGGVKKSGIGRESGAEAMDAYMTSKAVTIGANL